MLKSAFNALTRLHSRPAMLKRLGDVDIYSPIRITPSNYQRFLRGPEYTSIPGVEFIIPIDSVLGQYAQSVAFDLLPTSGSFKLQFGMNVSTALAYTTTAAQMQTALRLLPGMGNVLVEGNFVSGFKITFAGFQTQADLAAVIDSTLADIDSEDVEVTVTRSYTAWTSLLEKGDRIVDGSKLWSIDEIIEMNDVGAGVLGYRCRCD